MSEGEGRGTFGNKECETPELKSMRGRVEKEAG